MPNYQKTANALFKPETARSRPDSATSSMRLVTRRGVPVMCATIPRKPVFDAEYTGDVEQASGTQPTSQRGNRMQQIENEYLGTTSDQF